MQKFLILLTVLVGCGCSSLDKYRDYTSSAETRSLPTVKSTCSQNSDFETLTALLSNGARLDISIPTTRHFGFVGIPFIPLIPFWKSADLLEVDIRSPDQIKFAQENVYLIVGDQRLSPSHPVRSYTSAECGDGVSAAEKLKAAQSGNWPRNCVVQTSKLVFFKRPLNPVPDRVRIGLDGFELNGRRAETIELEFNRHSHWRYNALNTYGSGGPARCP